MRAWAGACLPAGRASRESGGWVDDGSIKIVEHYFEGLESSVDALNALFTGANTGKVIVRL